MESNLFRLGAVSPKAQPKAKRQQEDLSRYETDLPLAYWNS